MVFQSRLGGQERARILALLQDLPIGTDLVILLPEPVDRRVVDDSSSLETVGPDVGVNGPESLRG